MTKKYISYKAFVQFITNHANGVNTFHNTCIKFQADFRPNKIAQFITQCLQIFIVIWSWKLR